MRYRDAQGQLRHADLVCFVNGRSLAFIELKSGYKNIRGGFDGNRAPRQPTSSR